VSETYAKSDLLGGHLRRKPFYLDRIYAIQEELKNNLIIADSGLTVYTQGRMPLSSGCLCCKEGTWLCIFVGHKCNLSCYYCPQLGEDRPDYPRAFSSSWMDDIKTYVDLLGDTAIKGVSYTGGEPFLFLDKILPVAQFIMENKSSVYQWIYTNGLLVTEDRMKELRDCGISEIRFHLAASDFSETVISIMKKASKIFRRVTTENPTIKKVRDYFVENDGLVVMEDCGVSQVNLAELYFRTPKNNPGEETYLYNSYFGSAESPIYGRFWTYDIIRKAIEIKSSLTLNDCSNDTKLLQGLKRSMNPVLEHIHRG